eukprot:scaffold1620_cov420-Prasinococcus_capsulatus_cf.AAC.7
MCVWAAAAGGGRQREAREAPRASRNQTNTAATASFEGQAPVAHVWFELSKNGARSQRLAVWRRPHPRERRGPQRAKRSREEDRDAWNPLPAELRAPVIREPVQVPGAAHAPVLPARPRDCSESADRGPTVSAANERSALGRGGVAGAV